MAELSYNDVQRAVQENTRDIREHVIRMSQQMQRFNNMYDTHILPMRQEIIGMRRQINATNIQVSNVLARPLSHHASGIDPRMWQQLGNSIHAIDSRLVVMQKYLQEVSEYMIVLADAKPEDQRYQSP